MGIVGKIIVFIALSIVVGFTIWIFMPLTNKEKLRLAELKRTRNHIKRFMDDCYVTTEKLRMTEDVYRHILEYIQETITLLDTIEGDRELSGVNTRLEEVRVCNLDLKDELSKFMDWMRKGEDKPCYEFSGLMTLLHKAGDLMVCSAVDAKQALRDRYED